MAVVLPQRLAFLARLSMALALPGLVAGSSQERLRLRRVLKTQDSQPLMPAQVLPCSMYTEAMDPCTPDFSGTAPATEVTTADVEKANMQAFINEVIKQEDANVAARARESAVAALEIQKQREANEAALKQAKEEAMASVVASKVLAQAALTNATEAMIKAVAKRSALVGQREQLAKDQEIVAAILQSQANFSADAAKLVAAKALQDNMQASATAAVATQLESDAASPAYDISQENIDKANKVAENMALQANDLAQAAVQQSADHVMAQAGLLRGLKDQAKLNTQRFAAAETQLSNAYQAPQAFVNGIAQAYQGEAAPPAMEPIAYVPAVQAQPSLPAN